MTGHHHFHDDVSLVMRRIVPSIIADPDDFDDVFRLYNEIPDDLYMPTFALLCRQAWLVTGGFLPQPIMEENPETAPTATTLSVLWELAEACVYHAGREKRNALHVTALSLRVGLLNSKQRYLLLWIIAKIIYTTLWKVGSATALAYIDLMASMGGEPHNDQLEVLPTMAKIAFLSSLHTEGAVMAGAVTTLQRVGHPLPVAVWIAPVAIAIGNKVPDGIPGEVSSTDLPDSARVPLGRAMAVDLVNLITDPTAQEGDADVVLRRMLRLNLQASVTLRLMQIYGEKVLVPVLEA